MQASIVIPVWNGAAVVAECLNTLYANSSDNLLEVICVDNCSADNSAALITQQFPRVRLISEPVNLGFAGGVNAGLEVAQGDFSVLLNQDCLVQPKWLAEFSHAFETHSEFGIAGCTILFANGSIDHAGAHMTRPGAYGVHLTDLGNGQPRSVEYVTGAAMAIRQMTWQKIGRFDEGFYPAYYEEADYCYRARRIGLEIGYVPRARVIHLRNSREAQADWIKHWSNQHRARYRFISKHFDSNELGEFFKFEFSSIADERNFSTLVGRAIAARDILRGLPDIVQRRKIDRGEDLSAADRLQLQVGFTKILRQAFAAAGQGTTSAPIDSRAGADARWRQADQQLRDLLGLAAGRNREFAINRSGSLVDRFKRVLRRHSLNRSNRSAPVLISSDQSVTADQIKQFQFQLQQMYELFWEQRNQIDRRLTLLETLTDYDYR